MHAQHMQIQNLIKKTLSTVPGIEFIRDLLKSNEPLLRTHLAARACEHFKFYDTRGQLQISGCIKALRELESLEHFILPIPTIKPGKKSPKRLSNPLPQPVDVPDKAGGYPRS